MKLKNMIKKVLLCSALPSLTGCASVTFPTVPKVDLPRFMGTWYVSAGRLTIFEKGANNAVETYRYDSETKVINIDFSFRQGSPDGKEKRIPQKASLVDGSENAHWLVSPFWPLTFDYLIIALAEDYSWVAIGVPNQKYLWIMHRKKQAGADEIQTVIQRLNAIQYNTKDIVVVPQRWN